MSTILKSWAVHQALDHSKRTILLVLAITIILGFGIRFIFIDDNVKFISSTPDYGCFLTYDSGDFSGTRAYAMAVDVNGDVVGNNDKASTINQNLYHTRLFQSILQINLLSQYDVL